MASTAFQLESQMLRQTFNKLTFEDSTYKKILKNPFKSKIKLDCLCLCRGNMFHCKKIKGSFWNYHDYSSVFDKFKNKLLKKGLNMFLKKHERNCNLFNLRDVRFFK